jgi:hypothetical protein
MNDIFPLYKDMSKNPPIENWRFWADYCHALATVFLTRARYAEQHRFWDMAEMFYHAADDCHVSALDCEAQAFECL